jgi:hypothetical protein
MRRKKGQITGFIILGIVIIAFVSVFIFMNKTATTETAEVANPQAHNDAIKRFVSSCIRNVGQQGLYTNSLQGGYYTPPVLNQQYLNLEIPYYWYDQDNLLPDKHKIATEMSEYVDAKLPECINNFKNFEKEGYRFKSGLIKTDTEINEEEIQFTVNYPLTIIKDSRSTDLKVFTEKIQFNFNDKYEIIKNVLNKQEEVPKAVPLGFVSNLAHEKDFVFETVSLQNQTILYTFIFEENDDHYIFAYAAKYDWEEVK